MNTKEELLKKFEAFQHSKSHDRFGDLLNLNNIFDFFWKEMERTESDLSHVNGEYLRVKRELVDKISHLESTLEAVENGFTNIIGMCQDIEDYVVKGIKEEAIKKRNQLKTKSQS